MNCAKLWMDQVQDINLKEDGVSFSKEGFTQIYDEFNKDRRIIANGSLVGGALIGVGLSILAVSGATLYSQINKKRRLKKMYKRIEAGIEDVMNLVEISTEVEKAKRNM